MIFLGNFIDTLISKGMAENIGDSHQIFFFFQKVMVERSKAVQFFTVIELW